MTRHKNDGRRFPDEAVDACLAAAGIPRKEVDAIVTAGGLWSLPE
jgi:predicted NodU family carbamoyl transferase